MWIFRLSLWTLVFYTLLRVLFFVWNQSNFQSSSALDLLLAFLIGVRFDAWVVVLLSLPALISEALQFVFRRNWKLLSWFLFILFQIPFFIINLGDTEYIRFTGRRFSWTQMAVTRELEGKVGATILSYWPLFLISCVMVFGFLFFSWSRMKKTQELDSPRKIQFAKAVAVFLLVFLAARGGWQKKPLGFAHAQVFVQPQLNQLLMNSSFSLLQTLSRKPLPRVHWMSEDQMRPRLNASFPGNLHLPTQKFGKPQNVVLIIVESLNVENLGHLFGDPGWAPFLDELAQKSLFFPQAYANGRRSIEGVAALLAGVPALMDEPFISSPFATNQFDGWGSRFQRLKYSTAFFHGGKNGTMYFDQFARSAGIEKYYGANEYPNSKDHDGIWGIWDLPFFQQVIQEINQMPAPFAVALFTLSSHHPFKVPADFAGKFPKGRSEIHEVMAYTDYALRKFFEKASEEPWYKDTLFVITGDHTYSPVRSQFQNELGLYRVPLFFFHPQIEKWPQDIDRDQPVQQIDVLPSLSDFLGQKVDQENLLGRSVFRDGPRQVALYSDQTYWLIQKDRYLRVNAKGDEELFSGAHQKIQDTQVEQELLENLKATRQYFSEGLWDNRLYVPSGR